MKTLARPKARTDCRHFLGTKPCSVQLKFGQDCDSSCVSYSQVRTEVLIIHLGALGAVLRSTSLLMGIKRKFPGSRITWVTDRPGDALLRGHPLVDRVWVTALDDLLCLSSQSFDAAFVIDKSLKAAGILKWCQVDQIYGFVSDPVFGGIVPATPAAEELWQIGLSNKVKFFENKKPETRLLAEALEISYLRDEYNLPLTSAEEAIRDERRANWGQGKVILGLNTGCSGNFPNKKFSVQFHRELLRVLQSRFDFSVVLLGGPEDEVRNQQIAFGHEVIQSPTLRGLRDGLVSVAACDVIVTGDSLGLHMGISQKIWMIPWFGPTCAHEIDLFDRGEALVSGVTCGPCWKSQCSKSVMCYDQVEISLISDALQRFLAKRERDPKGLQKGCLTKEL